MSYHIIPSKNARGCKMGQTGTVWFIMLLPSNSPLKPVRRTRKRKARPDMVLKSLPDTRVYQPSCHSEESIIAGWWFGTFFVFPYIGNNYPNWLTHIFLRGWYTTNQTSSTHRHETGPRCQSIPLRSVKAAASDWWNCSFPTYLRCIRHSVGMLLATWTRFQVTISNTSLECIRWIRCDGAQCNYQTWIFFWNISKHMFGCAVQQVTDQQWITLCLRQSSYWTWP